MIFGVIMSLTKAGILCPEVNMKKILCLALCLVFCIGAFAGCSDLKEDEKGANVRVYLSDYPYTLDPAVVQLNSDVEQLLYMIYEPLTMIDEDGEVQPALATEWYYDYDEIYQLHKMYFELKATSWNDNRAVTADDVIYAWRRILSPETDSPYASLLFPIKGARALKSGVGTIDDLGLAAADDTLLEVTFEHEYDCDLFAEQVANVHLAPCREDIITRCEKEGEDWAGSAGTIVCNGPFRIQAMDMPRARKEGEENYSGKFACKLVLERNTYYMREDDQALDKYVTPFRITCYYFEGQSAYYKDSAGKTQEVFQSELFDAGEIFYLSSFSKDTYKKYADDMETANAVNGYAFYFNTNGENELLKDADVRKALSAALDRTAITGVTGTGELAATGYVPNGVFNTDNETDFREVGGNLYKTTADTAAAKKLLGNKKGTVTITYLVPQNAHTIKNYGNGKPVKYDNVYESIAKKAGENWKAIGINVEYRGLNPEEFTAALINRDFEVIGLNTNLGSVDAFAYLAPFAKEYSGAGTVVDNNVANDEEVFEPHYTNIDSAEYSKLITNALNAKDRASRAELLHKAEKMLVNELCPATMVFWYQRSFVANDDMIDDYDTDNWFGYVDMTGLELDDWREVNASEDAVSAAREEADGKKK